MITFVLTFAFLLLVVLGMAIGAIFANKPIKGSCGGIQQLGLGGECDICGGDMDKCDEENKRKEQGRGHSAEQFYDAS